jgi:hypothetical protein
MATRGSKKWLQVLVNERPDILDKSIGRTKWLSPLRTDEFAEYRDKAFVDILGIHLKSRTLSDFWPNGGPQWDALGISEAGEVVLVEAKAHINEILSNPSQASPESKLKILKSLAETSSAYCAELGLDWSRRFYQYANRLAHAFLFKELNNVPPRLIFLYFTGDA